MGGKNPPEQYCALETTYMQSVSKLMPWVQYETGNINLAVLFLELTCEHYITDCQTLLLLSE